MSTNYEETGFTLKELAFVLAIIVVFILLLSPFIINIRNKARIIACEENLEQIGAGLKLYAIEHDGKFPPNLGELIEGGYMGRERYLDCPSSPHTGNAEEPDYHYVTGHTAMSPSDTELVFDKDENHQGHRHVLYASGDIIWLASEPVSQ